MKTEQKIVMYESDEAAQLKTVTGWVSRDGRFFGNDEHIARFAGATHKLCECGKVAKISYIRCRECQHKVDVDLYNAMPFKEWDQETFVYSKACDKYFNDPSDIDEYCQENEIKPCDLMLVICEPNSFGYINPEYWENELSEDGELPEELEVGVNKINELIQTLPPASWHPGKIRTEYNPSNPTHHEQSE